MILEPFFVYTRARLINELIHSRRSQVYKDDDVAVVYSRTTEHPDAPPRPSNFRVEEYWCSLTIRPTSEGRRWDRDGIEFCLTAYENPGLSLPSSITTWVAMRGMPEFMHNLRVACMELKEWKARQREREEQQKERERGLPSLVSAVPGITTTTTTAASASADTSSVPAAIPVPVKAATAQQPKQQQQKPKEERQSQEKKYVYVNINL